MYDAEKKEAVKVQSHFSFPEKVLVVNPPVLWIFISNLQIYMERYLETEKETTIALREQRKALKQQELELNQEISGLTNYKVCL